MARPLRIEYAGAFYHVFQRGIEKKNIYYSSKDKDKFLSYIDSAYLAYGAIVHTYILMDNHYHMILETPRGNLNKIMHYLNTSYAIYFNLEHKRVGPLYQGRYKAILVQRDEYLHHLSRYIHLNPVRKGIVKYPEEYRWSSYKYFTSEQRQPRWLNTAFILSMFDNRILRAKRLYKQFVIGGIDAKINFAIENAEKGCILGNDKFVKFITKKFINKDDPEIPALRAHKNSNGVTLEHIKRGVERQIKDDKRLARKLSIYLSRKYTQYKLKDIANFYSGIGDAGVSEIFRRAQKMRGLDKELDELLSSLEMSLDLLNVET